MSAAAAEMLEREREMVDDSDGERDEVDVQRLDNRDFQCPLCMRIIHDPITLPCGHTYCRACMVRAFERKRICPTCRAPCRAVDPATLPMSTFVASLIEKANPTLVRQRRERAKRPRLAPVETYDVFVSSFVQFPKYPCWIHFYEPKYKHLIARAMSRTEKFVVAVFADESRRARPSRVGVVMRVLQRTRIVDGRSFCECVALKRVRLVNPREVPDCNGLLEADVESYEDVDGVDKPPPASRRPPPASPSAFGQDESSVDSGRQQRERDSPSGSGGRQERLRRGDLHTGRSAHEEENTLNRSPASSHALSNSRRGSTRLSDGGVPPLGSSTDSSRNTSSSRRSPRQSPSAFIVGSRASLSSHSSSSSSSSDFGGASSFAEHKSPIPPEDVAPSAFSRGRRSRSPSLSPRGAYDAKVDSHSSSSRSFASHSSMGGELRRRHAAATPPAAAAPVARHRPLADEARERDAGSRSPPAGRSPPGLHHRRGREYDESHSGRGRGRDRGDGAHSPPLNSRRRSSSDDGRPPRHRYSEDEAADMAEAADDLQRRLEEMHANLVEAAEAYLRVALSTSLAQFLERPGVVLMPQSAKELPFWVCAVLVPGSRGGRRGPSPSDAALLELEYAVLASRDALERCETTLALLDVVRRRAERSRHKQSFAIGALIVFALLYVFMNNRGGSGF